MAWNEHIDIHTVLDRWKDDPYNDGIIEDLRAEVRKSNWLARFAADLPDDANGNDIDEWLNMVYDAADRHRVWCGMPKFI